MARVIKEHQQRKGEIIAAARELFSEKGYEQTSVNDVLNKVGISKGTFYHYFKSKEDLLECMVDTMIDMLYPILENAVSDPRLGAVDKLNAFLFASGSFNLADRKHINTIGKAVFSDANLLARHKMINRNIEKFSPLITEIIRQGVSEGTFNTEYPEQAAELLLLTSRDLKERLGSRLFDFEDPDSRLLIEQTFIFWADHAERLLGASPGSIVGRIKSYLDDYLDTGQEPGGRQ